MMGFESIFTGFIATSSPFEVCGYDGSEPNGNEAIDTVRLDSQNNIDVDTVCNIDFLHPPIPQPSSSNSGTLSRPKTTRRVSSPLPHDSPPTLNSFPDNQYRGTHTRTTHSTQQSEHPVHGDSNRAPTSSAGTTSNLSPKNRNGQNRYLCTECEETFTNCKKFGKHMTLEHKISAFKCQFCNSPFTRHDYLKPHHLTCKKYIEYCLQNPQHSIPELQRATTVSPVQERNRHRVNIWDIQTTNTSPESPTICRPPAPPRLEDSAPSEQAMVPADRYPFRRSSRKERESSGTSSHRARDSMSGLDTQSTKIASLERKNRELEEQLKESKEGWAKTKSEFEIRTNEYFKLKRELLHAQTQNLELEQKYFNLQKTPDFPS
uniref:C2H2-type domain-containing protein n=1 Tax=Dactylellina haptotyla TaxID=430498 RepID=B2BK93_9PEZI|nr:hypothetical protein [Dactylellina haptotyla]